MLVRSNRAEKMAKKTQVMVGEILREKFIEDSVISSVSLSGATASADSRFVKLFYYTGNEDKSLVKKRLEEVLKMVRFELAARMNQKYVPEIQFIYDDTLERAGRIEKLLENL